MVKKTKDVNAPAPPIFRQYKKLENSIAQRNAYGRSIYRSLINCPFLLRTRNPFIQMLNMFVNIYKSEKCNHQCIDFVGKHTQLNFIHSFVPTPTSELVKKIYTTHQLVDMERYADAVLASNPRRDMIARLADKDVFRSPVSSVLESLDTHLSSNHTFMDHSIVRSINTK